MAIAYFIPDQAKLLAGQGPSRTTDSANPRTTSNTQPTSRLQQNNSVNENATINTTVNRGYGTTINISVPNFNNSTQEPSGCWDFLTQVFCHALRFYHESSQLQPTVIQISVNFNTQTTTSTSTAATTNTADIAGSSTTYTQESPATEEITNMTPTGARKLRKCSKRKN